MRTLAISRYRLWTTVRSATPLFLTVIVPPLVATAAAAFIEGSDIAEPDTVMSISATASIVAWLLHGALLFGLAHEFAQPKVASDASVHPSDLMDSAPFTSRDRFLGELSGVMASALVIHGCCLPVLTVLAALSPLPTAMFLCIEALIVAGILLGSASAAWRRVIGGPTRANAIRMSRSTLLFFLLLVFTILLTTDHVPFRDAAFSFVFGPSTRAWSRVVSAIDQPEMMAVLFALIFLGYLAFFFLSSIRSRAEA